MKPRSENTATLQKLYYAIVPGPWGPMGLAATDRGLLNIRSRVSSERVYINFLKRQYKISPLNDRQRIQPIAEQLTQYFRGQRRSFDISVDLLEGTEFQKQVWRKLAEIPYGETRSYAWLAQAVGRPRACRAVGNANGRNPIPILLPCHRVIASDGGLGGYTGGLPVKRALLNLERDGHAAL